MRASLAIVSVLLTISCQHKGVQSSAVMAKSADPKSSPGLMSRTRQLTFVGTRSGEGYFSPDGRKMIFQSERDAKNPFYQIFLMDLESGKTERISTGEGKTTCAWIHPSGVKALFASSHKDPHWRTKAKEESETRAKGERAKYAWSYDEHYELYERDLKSGALKLISPALGYDAEGSYSPDGQWIAFSSNRHAYNTKLSPDDQKRREQDPSYFLDIYIMRADGSELKRLTNVAGYDGGPFFSPDANYLTWRRFSADGRIAEVWTMKTDGTEAKQLTHLNAMSWAPFFHPSGDYLIFTTSLLGHDNFELFLVDRAGQHAPVRVSDIPGFDGLPVFTPDGQKMAWTHRNEKGESQIYMADWNDQAARVALGLKPAAVERPEVGQPAISAKDLRSWVQYLASDSLNGRASGSTEEAEYTSTIKQQFSRLGLKPMTGADFQVPFRFLSGVSLGATNQLTVTGLKAALPLEVNKDWAPMSIGKPGNTPQAGVVFAGYGIVAPASDKQPLYDSFQALDVKGKWALVLRDLPNEISNERRFHLNTYARIQHKALVANQAGAIGLLVVNPDAKAVKLAFAGGSGEAAIPVIEVSAALGEALIASSGQNFADLRKKLDAGEIKTAELSAVTVAAHTSVEQKFSEAANVVGMIKVSGAKSTLMFGAHGDHLGRGEAGNSLARADEKGQIHYGADDNASGVAAVLELAHYFAQEVASGRLKPKVNLAFAIWSGEELGILGSTSFVNHLGSDKVVGYLNMDMIGRLRESLLVQGVGSALEWPTLMEAVASQTDVPLSLQNDPYVPSDAMAFYLKKIPAISFFTGAHQEYHSPRDREELINFSGLQSVTTVVADLGSKLSREPKLTYVKVESSRKSGEGRGFRLYLGTIPDYTQEGGQGVKISGTTKASPAEKAGLLEGDVIIQLGGTKVSNLQDYVYCLQSMKANEKTSVKVMRQGRVVDLEITPALKGM